MNRNARSRGILRNVAIFSDLTGPEVDNLFDITEERSFSRGDMILNQEDEGDSMFVILKGRVKIFLMAEDGREVILSTLKPGDFFGEMSLLDGKPRSASALAIESTEVLVLRRDNFVREIRRVPEIALKIMSEMSARIRSADERIGSLSLLDVYGRVARVLLQLAQSEGKACPDGIIIDSLPTHHEIASMVGSSRETVSRVLGGLSRRGYLTLTGRRAVIHENLPREGLNRSIPPKGA